MDELERAPWRCHIFGHLWNEFQACERCGMPDYAVEFYAPSWNLFPYFYGLRWRLRDFLRYRRPRLFWRCEDPSCARLERVCGVKIGKHDKCEPMPF